MNIRKATRTGVRPLIGLFSESGCGKTYSSLLLARGFVGDNGKIAMIDTESGRGELYADVIPGGYDVLPLTPPFTPARYTEALNAVAAAGYSIAVIDSASHEWEGQGGVLDMAGENEERSGKSGLHNWKTPKMEHAKFLLSLLQSPLPVIVCLRAKYKTRQARNNGKTEIIKDEFTSPIQSEEFIFEMTVHGEIMPDHSFRQTKCSHPDLAKCFPSGKPITSEHGKALAAWCNGARAEAAKTAKAQLWELTRSIHGEAPDMLETWLREKQLIGDKQTLKGLKPAEFERLLPMVKAVMA